MDWYRTTSVNIALRRRWKLVAGTIMASAGMAFLAGELIPPHYTAKAQLLVEDSGASAAERGFATTPDTHVELLRSPSHIRLVKLCLRDPKTTGDLGLTGTVRPDATDEVLNADVDVASVDASLCDPPILTDEAARAAAKSASTMSLKDLQRGLSAYMESHSSVIAVTFMSQNPKTAAAVANLSAGLYIRLRERNAQSTAVMAAEAFAARLSVARVALDMAEVELREHSNHWGFGDGQRLRELNAETSGIKQQISRDAAELSAIDSQLTTLQEGLSTPPPDTPDPAPKLARLGAPSGDEVARLTPPAPTSHGALQSGPRGALSLERQAVAARLVQARERLAYLDGERKDLRTPMLRLAELERAVAAAKQVHEGLLQRKVADLSRRPERPGVELVSLADRPDTPSSPEPVLFALPAMVLAGMIAVFGVVVLERLDGRLRSPGDVHHALGIKCLGLIPRGRRTNRISGQRRLIDNQRDPRSEALRAATLTALNEGVRRSFLVTSSQSGSSATEFSVSFAICAALQGHRTLLIDFNCENQYLAGIIGESKVGLLPALLPNAEPRNVATHVADLEIDVIYAKQNERLSPALLSRQRVGPVLDRLAAAYDCIVINAEPCTTSTETCVLATSTDVTILVLKWNAEDVRSAQLALSSLHRLPGRQPAVEAVVSEVNLRRHRNYRYEEG